MERNDKRSDDIAEYAIILPVLRVIVVGTLRLIGSNAKNLFLMHQASCDFSLPQNPFSELRARNPMLAGEFSGVKTAEVIELLGSHFRESSPRPDSQQISTAEESPGPPEDAVSSRK